MFVFKKIVSPFFFPLPLSLAICCLGVVLLWFGKRQKAGKILVTVGVGLLALLSYSFSANPMVLWLEEQYPSYLPGSSVPVKYVVVLGGGHTTNPRLPASSQLSDESLKRLVEGIRLHRTIPGSQLVLSGGSWMDPMPDARLMQEVAEGLGVGRDELVIEDKSRDTRDEALLLKPVLGTNQFILVTSASHMPRSMALFKKEGMSPIAAPAGHLAKRGPWNVQSLFPGVGSLRKSDTAVYELMGLGWGRVRGEL